MKENNLKQLEQVVVIIQDWCREAWRDKHYNSHFYIQKIAKLCSDVDRNYEKESEENNKIKKLDISNRLIELRNLSATLFDSDRHWHYKLEDIIEEMEEEYKELGWLD